jgi:hypothetical protein
MYHHPKPTTTNPAQITATVIGQQKQLQALLKTKIPLPAPVNISVRKTALQFEV